MLHVILLPTRIAGHYGSTGETAHCDTDDDHQMMFPDQLFSNASLWFLPLWDLYTIRGDTSDHWRGPEHWEHREDYSITGDHW